MNRDDPGKTIIVTFVQNTADWNAARWMIKSLRAYGGPMSCHPVWVFTSSTQSDFFREGDPLDDGVEVYLLVVPERAKRYPFAAKVFACAHAEKMAHGQAHTLVWMDAQVLVVKPPLAFDLGQDYDAAFRPVHIKNVGLEVGTPLDGFWSKIYAAAGVGDVQQVVETFVGKQCIRAYFNSHAFSINPALGLLELWAALFEGLAGDKEFYAACCPDDLHRIFLFQALLSVLVVSRLQWERIKILPPTYNYPYHLHAKIPAERQAHALNDLVCIAYEECSLNPRSMRDLGVEEPLRSWLSAW